LSNPTDSYELYECPSWFQEKLTEIGGVNIYDEPNFRCVWGQGGQPEGLYRAGGHWHVEGQTSFVGYRDLLLGGGTPSWLLLQWHPAIHYGTPESYYVSTHDDETGLQDLGEYPYSGRYKVLYNMCYRGMVNGKFEIEAMPLNSFILDEVVPIILEAKDISYERTLAAMKGIKEKEDQADVDMVEDAMRDSKLAFKGPVSYARQGCRTSLIDRKMEQMQRHLNQMSANVRMLGKGMSSQPENSRLTQELLKSKIRQNSER
jgi:hypothetical protein